MPNRIQGFGSLLALSPHHRRLHPAAPAQAPTVNACPYPGSTGPVGPDLGSTGSASSDRISPARSTDPNGPARSTGATSQYLCG